MGEPTLFAKDLWRLGIGRIQVVPSVNVGYDNGTEEARDWHGRVEDYLDMTSEELQTEQVEWQEEPPRMVKCLEKFHELIGSHPPEFRLENLGPSSHSPVVITGSAIHLTTRIRFGAAMNGSADTSTCYWLLAPLSDSISPRWSVMGRNVMHRAESFGRNTRGCWD